MYFEVLRMLRICFEVFVLRIHLVDVFWIIENVQNMFYVFVSRIHGCRRTHARGVLKFEIKLMNMIWSVCVENTFWIQRTHTRGVLNFEIC